MREKIRLVSSAGTGHFYTTTKNKRKTPDKLRLKKYDPVVRQHAVARRALGHEILGLGPVQHEAVVGELGSRKPALLERFGRLAGAGGRQQQVDLVLAERSLAAVGGVEHADAQVRRPLLQEGKSALYQRVIAVPGAELSNAPGETADRRPVPPFTTYYVYDRSTEGQREWLEVGVDSTGSVDGWLPDDEAVTWKQTLTVGFRDPEEQARVLLFGDRDSLKEIIEGNDAASYRRLREQAAAGSVADSPVVPMTVATRPCISSGVSAMTRDWKMTPSSGLSSCRPTQNAM